MGPSMQDIDNIEDFKERQDLQVRMWVVVTVKRVSITVLQEFMSFIKVLLKRVVPKH